MLLHKIQNQPLGINEWTDPSHVLFDLIPLRLVEVERGKDREVQHKYEVRHRPGMVMREDTYGITDGF